ncbi:unnamed protein product [Protopolystoma xenopodis]|uniref:Uncharacterized protein n=1 Tax=Protopolystoma xenopodis TaxID=117903 RepID=A0A3S5ALU0_9PLAT|nr:unnamed protein product [Protopolystoma xenopodis]
MTPGYPELVTKILARTFRIPRVAIFSLAQVVPLAITKDLAEKSRFEDAFGQNDFVIIQVSSKESEHRVTTEPGLNNIRLPGRAPY